MPLRLGLLPLKVSLLLSPQEDILNLKDTPKGLKSLVQHWYPLKSETLGLRKGEELKWHPQQRYVNPCLDFGQGAWLAALY